MELKRAESIKSKLQNEFEKIDKKLKKNLRILNWQQKNICRKNDKLYSNNYKTTACEDKKCTPFKIMENIDSSMFNYNTTNLEIEKHKVPLDNKEMEKTLISLSNKIKSLQNNFKKDIKGKSNNQCLKSVNEFHQKTFDNDKLKILKEDFKNMGLKLEKQLFTEKIKNNKKVQRKITILKENRIVHNTGEYETDLDKNVKLFQKLLRGRAYQTMIMMANIRLKPFLQLKPAVEQKSIYLTLPDTRNHNNQNYALELSTNRYIGRFFDTLSKESIQKNEESKNVKAVELAEVTRTMREAYEGNRRQLEQAGRNEQDAILKQVLKIHQDLSEVFFEEFMYETIEQCTKEEGLKLMREITSKKTNRKNQFYNINKKNIEYELVFNDIIPEAYKIIHREETSYLNV